MAHVFPVRRAVIVAGMSVSACGALWWMLGNTLLTRALTVGVMYLALALSEIVPPFVPTLLLLAAVPLLLGGSGEQFAVGSVLQWMAEPVLALFGGGLALSLAAQRHGLDGSIAALLLRAAKGDRRRLLATVMLGTAGLSMWMSNIAAASLLLTALRPLLDRAHFDRAYRRSLLLAIAVAANLGGIATPIGSGPNAIAIAEANAYRHITFVGWIAFGLPLTLGMLALVFLVLIVRYRVTGRCDVTPPPIAALNRQSTIVIALFLLAVLGWLTEPLHGVPASLVAVTATFALFVSGVLTKDDLGRLDWSTLGLIAGGLAFGRLLEQGGLLQLVAREVEWSAYPPLIWLGGFVLLSAAMAAVMSNTATAALLIPVAMTLEPTPGTAIIIAVATSFGMPFVISTPPNAIAYGAGDLPARDLGMIGVPVMLLGCALITATGRWVLAFLGVA